MPKLRRLFLFFIAFFLAVKLLYVLVPPVAMGIARMGDDAYVQLWKGWNAFVARDPDALALRNINELHKLSDDPSEEVQFRRNRVAMRAHGILTPLNGLLHALPLAAGLSGKWTFALIEALGAILFTAALAYFLTAIWGLGVAAFGLLAATFSVGPLLVPGLQVPGIHSLAFALFAWALLLRKEKAALPILSCGFLSITMHPAGQLFLGVALLIGLWKRRPWPLLVSLAVLAALSPKAYLLALGFPPSPSGGTGALGPRELLYNLPAVPQLIAMQISRAFVPMFLGVLGIVFYSKRVFNSDARIVTGIFALPLAASLFFSIPGYPGDLFSRIFGLYVFLLSGAAGLLLCALCTEKVNPRVRGVTVLVLVGLLAWDYTRWSKTLFYNLNNRREVIDEGRLKTQVQKISTKERVLFLDPDIAMMAAFLAGGTSLDAYPYTMLRFSPNVSLLEEKLRPTLFVTLPNENLNSLSIIGSRSLRARRNGFHLRYFNEIGISDFGRRPELISLFLEGKTEGDFVVNVRSDKCEAENVRAIQETGWATIVLSQCFRGLEPGSEIRVLFPEADVWISGIQTTRTNGGEIRWPWSNSAFRLAVRCRRKNPNAIESIEYDFSWREVFKLSRAEELFPALRGEFRAVSDESGILFFERVMP